MNLSKMFRKKYKLRIVRTWMDALPYKISWTYYRIIPIWHSIKAYYASEVSDYRFVDTMYFKTYTEAYNNAQRFPKYEDVAEYIKWGENRIQNHKDSQNQFYKKNGSNPSTEIFND